MAEENTLQRLMALLEESLGGLGSFGQIIVATIRGFFNFLTNAFAGNDVADGDGRETEHSSGRQGVFNNILASARSAGTWAKYQRDNDGKAVNHRSPLEGNSVVGDDRHMRENHPIHHDRRMHHGIDLPRSTSTSANVIASESGIVIFSGVMRGYGNTVVIGHADGGYSVYAHLTGENMPSLEQEVAQGQRIGIMGRSGGATGVHLHYEQRKGSESVVPVIDGRQMTRGVQINNGPRSPVPSPSPRQGEEEQGPPMFAGLLSRNDFPTLSLSSTGYTPSLTSPVFASTFGTPVVGSVLRL